MQFAFARLFYYLKAPFIIFMDPLIKFLLPRHFFSLNGLATFSGGGVTVECSILQSLKQCLCGCFGVATDTHGNVFDQAQHLVIGIDLDNVRVIWPVLHAVLGQRPKRPKASAQCQHDIGPAHQFHTGFRALVTQRPTPKWVTGRERIVVQITVDHRSAKSFSQGFTGVNAVRHDHTAT